MALGFVNKKEDSTKPATSPFPFTTNNPVNTVNDSYRKRVTQLEEDQRNSHRQLDRIREMLLKCQTTSAEIRRKAIRLKPNVDDNNDESWDEFISLTRELRFGFDEIIREANTKGPIQVQSVTSTSNTTDSFADPYENEDPKFVVAAREDLIAEYLGQTAPKTKKVLERARGGVLFIDEAYSLCNMDGGSKDKYGEECLTTINEFMSLHPDEIIIIFAGYKDKLMSSIFKAQPGLMRRCAYFFEIKDYTINGLNKIFRTQLSKNGWSLDQNVKLHDVFTENQDLIRDGGGGFTESLVFFCKLAYGNSKFDETVNNINTTKSIHDSVITETMLHDALIMLRKSLITEIDNASSPPVNMYL